MKENPIGIHLKYLFLYLISCKCCVILSVTLHLFYTCIIYQYPAFKIELIKLYKKVLLK